MIRKIQENNNIHDVTMSITNLLDQMIKEKILHEDIIGDVSNAIAQGLTSTGLGSKVIRNIIIEISKQV